MCCWPAQALPLLHISGWTIWHTFRWAVVHSMQAVKSKLDGLFSITNGFPTNRLASCQASPTTKKERLKASPLSSHNVMTCNQFELSGLWLSPRWALGQNCIRKCGKHTHTNTAWCSAVIPSLPVALTSDMQEDVKHAMRSRNLLFGFRGP